MKISNIRKNFPILKKKINKNPFIYLDNAASCQIPKKTINSFKQYYSNFHSNIYKGTYNTSEIATKKYENTRKKIKNYIKAKYDFECIFVKGTTEAINLIVSSWGEINIKKNDEIIITEMEHHSNIIPWKILCKTKSAKLKILPINQHGELKIKSIEQIINKKTKIISVTHVSNVLGTINPIKKIIKKAKSKKIPVIIDAAQSISQISINVQELDCDFFVFSGHKMYAPTGVGVMYAKKSILKNMKPYHGGGNMVLDLDLKKKIIYNKLPHKFEAGTPSICNIIAFKKTIQFLEKINQKNKIKHENELLTYTTKKLKKIKELNIIGNPKNKIGIISFIINKIHTHDIGSILNQYGIAIRTGHHCAIPTIKHFKINSTARISIGLYNTYYEIDKICKSLSLIIKFLRK